MYYSMQAQFFPVSPQPTVDTRLGLVGGKGERENPNLIRCYEYHLFFLLVFDKLHSGPPTGPPAKQQFPGISVKTR